MLQWSSILFRVDGRHIRCIPKLLIMPDNRQRVTARTLMLGIIAYLLRVRNLVGAAAAERYASYECAYLPIPSIQFSRSAKSRVGRQAESLTYFVCSLGILKTWVIRRLRQFGQSTQSGAKAKPLVGLTSPALPTSCNSAMMTS